MQVKGKSVGGELLSPEESGPTAQRRKGGGRETWEPGLGEEEGKTLEPLVQETVRWEKPSSHHH